MAYWLMAIGLIGNCYGCAYSSLDVASNVLALLWTIEILQEEGVPSLRPSKDRAASLSFGTEG
jgi:hypothetical protein